MKDQRNNLESDFITLSYLHALFSGPDFSEENCITSQERGSATRSLKISRCEVKGHCLQIYGESEDSDEDKLHVLRRPAGSSSSCLISAA